MTEHISPTNLSGTAMTETSRLVQAAERVRYGVSGREPAGRTSLPNRGLNRMLQHL